MWTRVSLAAVCAGLLTQGCGGGTAEEPPTRARGGGAPPATRIVALPRLAVLSYVCDRPARTFATQIAVPRMGTSLEFTRLSPRRMPTERLAPGRHWRSPSTAARRERWKLRSVDKLATTTARVTLVYESRPVTHDCVVKVLRVNVTTRSHSE